MNKKLIIACAFVAYLGSAQSAPPDPLTQFLYGAIGCVFAVCVLLFVLSREVVRESKPTVQKLIAWLITFCVVAASFAISYRIIIHGLINRIITSQSM